MHPRHSAADAHLKQPRTCYRPPKPYPTHNLLQLAHPTTLDLRSYPCRSIRIAQRCFQILACQYCYAWQTAATYHRTGAKYRKRVLRRSAAKGTRHLERATSLEPHPQWSPKSAIWFRFPFLIAVSTKHHSRPPTLQRCLVV